MSHSLAEALRHVDLQPGRTYQEEINGRKVEVRVVDTASPNLIEQQMLEPWIDFPFTSMLTIQAQPGRLPLPDAPVIPTDADESVA